MSDGTGLVYTNGRSLPKLESGALKIPSDNTPCLNKRDSNSSANDLFTYSSGIWILARYGER